MLDFSRALYYEYFGRTVSNQEMKRKGTKNRGKQHKQLYLYSDNSIPFF